MAAGRRGCWLRFAAVVAAALAFAALFRYQVLTSQSLNWICEGGGGPWWCALRRLVNAWLRAQVLGVIGVAAALYAVCRGGPAALGTAAALGAAGVLLWSPELSAAAVLLVALRLARPPSAR